VFGPDRVFNTHRDVLTVQAGSGRWDQVLSVDELNGLGLDRSKFPQNYDVWTPRHADSTQVLAGQAWDKLGDFHLAVVPVAEHPQSSIGILLGYDSANPSSEPENSPDGDLDQAMRSFYTLTVSALAATLARGAEDLANKQLLYLGHEAAQLTAGLDWLRLTYAEPRALVERLKQDHAGNLTRVIEGLQKKIKDLCGDIRGLTGQMSFFFEMAKELAKHLNKESLPAARPKEFLPFGDVLFKWKDSYRYACEEKRLQVRVAYPDAGDRPRLNDPRRPKMYADPFLFEQVVYNLMNNAEKYCYRGTKIDIDCRLESPDLPGDPHILTVTNYGIYMARGDDVYLPFRRRKTQVDVEGLGLGLYIAWLIVVKVHGGVLTHECPEQPVSPFNVPLIRPYIERTFEGKDQNLAGELKKELSRLEAEGLYDAIVAYEPERDQSKVQRKQPRYNNPADETLCNEIRERTYKVTLRAVMPNVKGS